jgi:galactokinase
VRLLAAFQQAYPDTPTWIVHAPGREMWVAAALAGSDQFTLVAPDLEAQTAFTLRSAKLKQTVMQRPLPRWARYPAGVTLVLHDAGLDVAGMKLAVVGEEPPGPRFDYGIGIVFAALWHELHGQDYTIDQLIEIVDHARREYVGE